MILPRRIAAVAGVWCLRTGFAAADVPDCLSDRMPGVLEVQGGELLFLAGGTALVEGGQSITLVHNSGLSAQSSCDPAPESYARLQLLGRSFSFTVDLSRVGCGCNVAVYLISALATDAIGSPLPGAAGAVTDPYYCDANQVGGQWCPEVDLMEANDHAFQATAHKCDPPVEGRYLQCDRVGLAMQTRRTPRSYGPGSGYMIDTSRPFTVTTDFPQDEAGQLAGMRTELTQDERRVVLELPGLESRWYLTHLSEVMAGGMSLRISYWGGSYSDMSWLDNPPCDNTNCTEESAGTAVIRDFRIEPSRVVPPPPLESLWVADQAAPWKCHTYQGAAQQVEGWCEHVGFDSGVDGSFEYSYNGGHSSPCGGCWCCRRPARLTDVLAAAPPVEVPVWVVTDPSDPWFGMLVPDVVAAELQNVSPELARGVAQWANGEHLVQRMLPSEVGRLSRSDPAGGIDGLPATGSVVVRKFSLDGRLSAPPSSRTGSVAGAAIAIGLVASATALLVRTRGGGGRLDRRCAAGADADDEALSTQDLLEAERVERT